MKVDEREYHKRQERRFPQHACDLNPHPDRVYPQLPPNASFWPRIRLCVQKWLIGWRRSTPLRTLHPSTYSLEYEQARHVRSRYWWVVHPYSRLSCFWQLVMIATITMHFVITPFQMVFLDHKSLELNNSHAEIVKGTYFDKNNPDAKRYMELFEKWRKSVVNVLQISHTMFYGQIILLFVTGYFVPETGEVVLQPGRIIKRYLTTWFIVDIVTSVRLGPGRQDLTRHSYVKGWFDTRIAVYVWNVYMLMRITRVRFLLSYTSNWCHMFHVRPVYIRAVKYLISFTTFIMSMVLLSYLLPLVFSGADMFRNDTATRSWIMDPDLGYFDPYYPNLLARQVLLCLYRTICTISQAIPYTTNDSPRVTQEDYVWLLITMWSGTVFKIVLITLILQYVESNVSGQLNLAKVKEQVRTYMRDRDLPMHVRHKMLLYYSYRFEDRFFHERAILAHLPSSIRNSVRQSGSQRLVSGCELFRGVPKSLVNSIVAALEEVLYLPHDVVYASGDSSHYLFFLNSGTVGVYLSTGEELCHLEDGASFGEMGLMLSEHRRKHLESAVALEVCEVFRLHRRSFNKLVKPLPRLYNRIRAGAMLRADEVARTKQYNEWVDVTPPPPPSTPRLSVLGSAADSDSDITDVDAAAITSSIQRASSGR